MTDETVSPEVQELRPGLRRFEYQRLVCSDVLLPWLGLRLELDGIRVADVGAHHGGMLEALRESGVVGSALGIELREDAVAASPFVSDERFRLEAADVRAMASGEHAFDLVLVHDVLEHIPETGEALDALRRLLAPNGHVFVSFPPYYAGFGGHQQFARGRARMVPFLHLLPERLFFHLVRPQTKDYLSAEEALDDLVSVRRTRLTLRKAERAFAGSGFEVVARQLYLVRPEYTIRYGLRERRAAVLGALPGVREIAVNGAFYLLRAA